MSSVTNTDINQNTILDMSIEIRTIGLGGDVSGAAKDSSHGITMEEIKKMKFYQGWEDPRSQYDQYRENGSPPFILKLAKLEGKCFGARMEKLARERFNFDKPTDSSHDHKKNGKTFEQKSGRWYKCGGDWKWQHIEMKHEWEYLLLLGVDYLDFKFYIASRDIVEQLIKEGIITGQGKKINGKAQAQQAYWFRRSDFKKKNKNITDYFTTINNEEDLIDYIS